VSKTRKSIYFSFFSKGIGITLQIVSVAVISRLLTPEEVGVFSIAVSLTTILHALRSAGLTDYIVVDKNLSIEKVSTCFTVICLISWFFSLLLWAGADAAGSFYGNDGITNVLLILAINFFLVPLSNITLAMLRRNLDFHLVAITGIIYSFVNTLSTIYLAYAGYSYMALAYGSLLATIVQIIVLGIMMPRYIAFKPTIKEWKKIVSFSSFTTARTLVGHTSVYLNDLMIGRLIDIKSVAIFSRGVGLLNIFQLAITDTLWPIVQSWMAKDHRDNGTNQIKENYLRLSRLFTGLAWPFYGVMFFLAEDITLLFFGPQWLESVPLCKVMCIAMAIDSTHAFLQPTLTSLGHVKVGFYLASFDLLLKIIGISIGYNYGLEAIAYSLTITAVFSAFASYFLLKRILSIPFFLQLSSLFKSAIITASSLIVAGATVNVLSHSSLSNWITIVIAGSLSIIIWYLTAAALKHEVHTEILESYRNTFK